MTSAINPNNIDSTYPVAGQDNDSQGFRDNFTNIKTNFAFAAAEITDLENKAVLKSALTGTTLNNNMGGSILSNAQLQNITATRITLGTTSGNITLNYVPGPYYTVTTSGSLTLAFSNLPSAGTVGVLRLRITVASTAHTLTLPAAVSVGVSNLQGYNAGVISFNQTGVFEFEFETSDGGATISIFDLNRNRDPLFLPSAQLLSANGAVNTAVTTTVITSSGDVAATLAAGSEGQIKILAYGNTSVGNCLVTVTNAAWGSVANLSAVGSAATLQYINSKWFCIGNNGVTFT